MALVNKGLMGAMMKAEMGEGEPPVRGRKAMKAEMKEPGEMKGKGKPAPKKKAPPRRGGDMGALAAFTGRGAKQGPSRY